MKEEIGERGDELGLADLAPELDGELALGRDDRLVVDRRDGVGVAFLDPVDAAALARLPRGASGYRRLHLDLEFGIRDVLGELEPGGVVFGRSHPHQEQDRGPGDAVLAKGLGDEG